METCFLGDFFICWFSSFSCCNPFFFPLILSLDRSHAGSFLVILTEEHTSLLDQTSVEDSCQKKPEPSRHGLG